MTISELVLFSITEKQTIRRRDDIETMKKRCRADGKTMKK
jgi:hypothetical protein